MHGYRPVMGLAWLASVALGLLALGAVVNAAVVWYAYAAVKAVVEGTAVADLAVLRTIEGLRLVTGVITTIMRVTAVALFIFWFLRVRKNVKLVVAAGWPRRGRGWSMQEIWLASDPADRDLMPHLRPKNRVVTAGVVSFRVLVVANLLVGLFTATQVTIEHVFQASVAVTVTAVLAVVMAALMSRAILVISRRQADPAAFFHGVPA